MPLTASIVITTKNRKEELRLALRSAVTQSGQPEIIVLDDGSTDGTAELVRVEFPQVTLHRFEESKGLVVRRNEGARLAAGDVIFSIDDDAMFSTPRIVEQTLGEMCIRDSLSPLAPAGARGAPRREIRQRLAHRAADH